MSVVSVRPCAKPDTDVVRPAPPAQRHGRQSRGCAGASDPGGHGSASPPRRLRGNGAGKAQRLTSPQLRQLFSTHVRDLVALAVGATRETGEVARGRGLRAARLSAIKGDIMGQLDNEGLCVTRRGSAPRCDARYVQMLFESEGRRSRNTSSSNGLLVRSANARRPRHQRSDDQRHRIRGRVRESVLFQSHVPHAHCGMTPSDARRAGSDASGV